MAAAVQRDGNYAALYAIRHTVGVEPQNFVALHTPVGYHKALSTAVPTSVCRRDDAPILAMLQYVGE